MDYSGMSHWITVREAAEILGVHMSAIPKMIRRGDLTPRRQRPRMNRAEVEALREHRAALRPDAAPQVPQPPNREHDWLSAPLAAAVVGCSVVALNARARRGRIRPPYQVVGAGTASTISSCG